MKRRVVVTGLGTVTPSGNTVEEFWMSVKKGTVGIGEITKSERRRKNPPQSLPWLPEKL